MTTDLSKLPKERAVKAYIVSSDSGDASVLVWERTPGLAKAMAHGTDWFCDEEWVDLRCKREQNLDKLHDSPYVVDGSTESDCRIMWELGWYQLEGSGLECGICGRHEWHNVPESQVSDDGVCANCIRHAALEATEEGNDA